MAEEKIFADSLIETSLTQRARRSFTTLTSFGVQLLAIGFMLLLPLWRTVGLPAVKMASTPISMGSPSPELPAPPRRGPGGPVLQTVVWHPLILPSERPRIVTQGGDDAAPPISDPGLGGGPYIPGAPSGPLIPAISGNNAPPILATKPTVRAFRTSSILEGSLIRRIEPAYPPLAQHAHIQGSVVLAAVISRTGEIENLRVISGHPMLVPSAIDAVSQWRYRPYVLNNEAIEVETQITVRFFLGGS